MFFCPLFEITRLTRLIRMNMLLYFRQNIILDTSEFINQSFDRSVTMKIIEAKSEQEKKDVYDIRDEVFIKEQGFKRYMERDKHEDEAIHIICYEANQPVGTTRVLVEDNIGTVQRVAVLKPFRNQGYGKNMMLAIEDILAHRNLAALKLDSQAHAISFYDSLGFKKSSDPYIVAGIEHVEMIKELN